MSVPDFDKFSEDWINFCRALGAQATGTNREKAKFKGFEFEKRMKEVLVNFVPKGFHLVCQKKIDRIGYMFDFVIVKDKSKERGDLIPNDVIAVFEVKAHGFYSYESIGKIRELIEQVQKSNSKIRMFYITYRETNTYDKKVREIFKELVSSYYRLSDSGDGVQIEPRRTFKEEWERLMVDLKTLK
jgi:hypothetical protein